MKIEKSNYEGYLWYSDNTQPQVILDQEFELDIDENKNPFIVEGFLFDGEKSISIKYVDGQYICKKYALSDFEKLEYAKQTFYSHRMNDRKLVFNQYWCPKEDDLCEGMEVLKPAELIFVGFEKNNKEE